MSRNARLASVVAVARAVRLAARPGGPSIGERAGSVPRMVRATFSGQYTGVSKGRLLLMLGAAGYIVSPIDLIPEAVAPVLGLADDALVLSWLATRLVEETEAFLAWEQAGMPPTSAGAGGGSGAASPSGSGASGSSGAAAGPPPTNGSSPAGSQTVPGDVIR
jgi:uncharacterized membrane protein YkvA (DUF1232 family)